MSSYFIGGPFIGAALAGAVAIGMLPSRRVVEGVAIGRVGQPWTSRPIHRDRGVRDWGWMIEGHGGVLDRLDSVIFAAPVFFHMTRCWWTV
jgi:phosphatidate cytidylyltransferase